MTGGAQYQGNLVFPQLRFRIVAKLPPFADTGYEAFPLLEITKYPTRSLSQLPIAPVNFNKTLEAF